MRANEFDAGSTARSTRLLERPAERLVVVGFRCWMAGYEFGSIDCWEVAWNVYARDLGSAGARRVFGDLQYWVRAVRDANCRTIECFPHCCNCLCRDECMALSVISALQEGNRDLARTAAHYLTGATQSPAVDTVIAAADTYSSSLLSAGRRLIGVTPGVVETIANHTADARRSTLLMH